MIHRPEVKQDLSAEAPPTPIEISKRTGRPKRRKATRACGHCQRLHLTCENKRPCERCISRGDADTCSDGVRKKAKYLRADELTAKMAAEQGSREPSLAAATAANRQKEAPRQVPLPLQMAYPPDQKFQSHATDLEYNVLGHILHPDHSDSSPSFSDDAGPIVNINNYSLQNTNLSDLMAQYQPVNDDWMAPRQPPISLTVNDPDFLWERPLHSQLPQSQLLAQPRQYQPQGPQGLQGPNELQGVQNRPHQLDGSSGSSNGGLQMLPRVPSSTAIPAVQARQQRAPREIYRSVTRAFPYTPGFHALLRYIKSRFHKSDLMAIVRSMASYRPSFIACTNSLTEDDLVFMEQCFQRTLLEYEKYFIYVGTPTLIWRRTGQIAAVGPEFCMLSGWSRDSLVPDSTPQTSEPGSQLPSRAASTTSLPNAGAGRFVVELMDDQSAVNYFKMFSEISFNDSRGAVMSRCTLITPQGSPVRTSSVLTLRRDMFGIPMMIVGSFLPILA